MSTAVFVEYIVLLLVYTAQAVACVWVGWHARSKVYLSLRCECCHLWMAPGHICKPKRDTDGTAARGRRARGK